MSDSRSRVGYLPDAANYTTKSKNITPGLRSDTSLMLQITIQNQVADPRAKVGYLQKSDPRARVGYLPDAANYNTNQVCDSRARVGYLPDTANYNTKLSI